jgi:hypothetical protein
MIVLFGIKIFNIYKYVETMSLISLNLQHYLFYLTPQPRMPSVPVRPAHEYWNGASRWAASQPVYDQLTSNARRSTDSLAAAVNSGPQRLTSPAAADLARSRCTPSYSSGSAGSHRSAARKIEATSTCTAPD